eukprot:10235481-Alexandrium_andersonii.AAC.1
MLLPPCAGAKMLGVVQLAPSAVGSCSRPRRRCSLCRTRASAAFTASPALGGACCFGRSQRCLRLLQPASVWRSGHAQHAA